MDDRAAMADSNANDPKRSFRTLSTAYFALYDPCPPSD